MARGSPDFQRSDLVTLQAEDVLEVHRAALEIARDPAEHDDLAISIICAERLDRVVILFPRPGIPCPYGSHAAERSSFITDDAIPDEATGERIRVARFLRGEICCDRLGQIHHWDRHILAALACSFHGFVHADHEESQNDRYRSEEAEMPVSDQSHIGHAFATCLDVDSV